MYVLWAELWVIFIFFEKKNSFHLSLMLVCLFIKCLDYLFKSEISILWPQHFWKVVMISLVSMIQQIFSLQKSSFFLRSDRMAEWSNNRMIKWSNNQMIKWSNLNDQIKLTLWLTFFKSDFLTIKEANFRTNFLTGDIFIFFNHQHFFQVIFEPKKTRFDGERCEFTWPEACLLRIECFLVLYSKRLNILPYTCLLVIESHYI
jgi:hypothetical protein